MSTIAASRSNNTAQDLFSVLTQLSLATQAAQRRRVELKEFEFLTLSILHTRQTMIVGDIQRQLGILPAQMSRIIRSLENRQIPFIECQINAKDKRKIDVRLTSAGEQALQAYQENRIRKLGSLLKSLSPTDQEDLSRWIQRLHELLRAGKIAETAEILV